MRAQLTCASALLLLLAPVHARAVVIVAEDFEPYGNTDQMQAVWINPVAGTAVEGTLATDFGNPGQSGFNPGTAPNPSNVNQRSFAPIAPDADTPIRLQVDIYDDATSPDKRHIIGLRQTDPFDPSNFLEMGFYDSHPAPFYAYRIQLFSQGDVGYGVFSLPDDQDQPDEVGPGWHRYAAIVRTDSVRLSLDLYADGAIDAVDLISASPYPLPRGFNNIRWGGPQGMESPAGGGFFDNILLQTVLLGDANRDTAINGLDVTPFVALVLDGTYQAESDVNQDEQVNGLDVDPFVAAVLAGVSVAAVPEPSTWILLAAGVLVLAWRRSRATRR